jgi:hypothetical protein
MSNAPSSPPPGPVRTRGPEQGRRLQLGEQIAVLPTAVKRPGVQAPAAAAAGSARVESAVASVNTRDSELTQ